MEIVSKSTGVHIGTTTNKHSVQLIDVQLCENSAQISLDCVVLKERFLHAPHDICND